MTLDERADGTLVVSYDSVGLTRLMLAATVLFLAVAGYDIFLGARDTERLIGLLASAGTCLLVALVFLERAWFEFAPDRQTVTWRRRWALQNRSGSIPFRSIRSVLVEQPIGDEGTPSRRITLKTVNGDIPITVGYRPDADGLVVEIARRLRALLGHDTGATHMANVKALVAAGKTIDAIRVLREEEGLSLVEAKRRVEEIVATRGNVQ
jgi:hypothetical protein